MIDTHCHLDTAAFDADRAEVIARAMAAGVTGMLVPAIRPATWQALVELARAQSAIRVAVGVHPQIVPEVEDSELTADLASAIARAADQAGDTVVAIGECGLDGGTADHDRQERIFRAHIRAARTTGKPLVIHVLRAHDLAPKILREERAHEVGGVLHSYSGGEQLVSVYRDLGMCFSFAGPITYENARRPLAAARAIPSELLLAETDAPDQSPAAHRGQRCEPAFVADVLAGLATARDATIGEITALTTANAQRLFRAWL